MNQTSQQRPAVGAVGSPWGRPRNRARGMALVMALLITVLVSLVAIVMSMISNQALDLTRRRNAAIRTFYVTEGVAQKVHGEIDFLYRSQGGTRPEDLENIAAPEFDIYRVITEQGGPGLDVAAVGDPVFELLSSGAYAGLYAYRQGYVIDATVALARSDVDFARAKKHRLFTVASVKEDINALAIPLVQFLAFYDTDLEILPGPTMEMEGRVHTNGNLYLGTHNSLNFRSGISAVGNIFHGRLDSNTAMDGAVNIADGAGILRSLRNADGTWLDSNADNWAEEAINRFGGRIQSGDHRVPQLRLPIEFSEQPHDILERSSPADSNQLRQNKFENKATLKIINGVGYDRNGRVVSLTYPNPAKPSQTKSIVSTTRFYDNRESKWVSVIDIDVANLLESGINTSGLILYVDHTPATSGDIGGVRLINAKKLPSSGMTVASPKPVYIKGDFNTVNKVPSLVAADAVNVLSNNWNDANSSKRLADRTATNTTVNTVIMTGKVSTVAGRSYSGGYENLPRFHENWSGKTLTFRGGMVCMWESEVAVGQWRYGDPVYNAPNRDWRYDTMYQNPVNSPPGIPVVYALEVANYEHQY